MPLNFIYVLTISLHLLLPSPSLRPHDEKYARVRNSSKCYYKIDTMYGCLGSKVSNIRNCILKRASICRVVCPHVKVTRKHVSLKKMK